MQLLDIKVRPDWKQITRDQVAESSRLWRIVQATVVLSTLAVLLLMALNLPASSQDLFRMLVFPSFLLVLPLWAIYRSHDLHHLAVWDYVVLVGVGFIGYYVAFRFVGSPDQDGVFVWASPLSVLLPLISWPMLLWAKRRFPDGMRELGIEWDNWRRNVIIGIAIGTTLGFHLLFVTNQMSGVLYPDITGAALIWTLFYHLGLGALGEEFCFRGLGFHLLVHGMHKSPSEATLRIVILNLLIYFVPASLTANVVTGLLVLVYGAGLVLVTTILRHRYRSLIPGIACNVLFSVFLGMVIT